MKAVLDAAISNEETRAEAQAMLDAGESYFDDFLHDHTDGLTTWQVDEAEIEVPIVDELVGALVEMLRDVAPPPIGSCLDNHTAQGPRTSPGCNRQSKGVDTMTLCEQVGELLPNLDAVKRQIHLANQQKQLN